MTSLHFLGFLGDVFVAVSRDGLLLYKLTCHSSDSMSSEQIANCGYGRFFLELQATGKQTAFELELNSVFWTMEMHGTLMVLVKAPSLCDLHSFCLGTYQQKLTSILEVLDFSLDASGCPS